MNREAAATQPIPPLPQAWFRFYGDLNDFLPHHQRQRDVPHPVQEHSSIKDTLEAIGVPHPEIGLILMDGLPVDFGQRVPSEALISVYPHFSRIDVSPVSPLPSPPPPEAIRFVLDVHLGKLASYLRLLGFDTSYRNDATDAELAREASTDDRTLLSRDRGLLRRRLVIHGALVRAEQPRLQLLEVVGRFRLDRAMRPYSRCPRCNGLLEAVARSEVEHELPFHTRRSHSRFSRCGLCGRLYWKGAHQAGIRSLLDAIKGRQAPSSGTERAG